MRNHTRHVVCTAVLIGDHCLVSLIVSSAVVLNTAEDPLVMSVSPRGSADLDTVAPAATLQMQLVDDAHSIVVLDVFRHVNAIDAALQPARASLSVDVLVVKLLAFEAYLTPKTWTEEKEETPINAATKQTVYHAASAQRVIIDAAQVMRSSGQFDSSGTCYRLLYFGAKVWSMASCCFLTSAFVLISRLSWILLPSNTTGYLQCD